MRTIKVTLVAMIAAVVMLSNVSSSWAQQKGGESAKQLLGTWTLVSNNITHSDGKKVQPFGPNPAGMLIFDSGGHYSLQICRPDRAKFAANNREKGTPEENQAAVTGCNPHWGKYSVDGNVIVFKIEHAQFPNWEGVDQKRNFILAGNELKYTVTAASAGGTAEVVWRRAQ